MLKRLLGLVTSPEATGYKGSVEKPKDPQVAETMDSSHQAVTDTLNGAKFLSEKALSESPDHKRETRTNGIGGTMTVFKTKRIPPELDYGTPTWHKPKEHLVVPRGPFTESKYAEIAGHVRLVKEEWKGPDEGDRRNGNTLDVKYDAQGFPVECLVSSGDGVLVRRVLNTFDPTGRLLEQRTISYQDDGTEGETETRVQTYYEEGPFAGLVKSNSKKGSTDELDEDPNALNPLPYIGYIFNA